MNNFLSLRAGIATRYFVLKLQSLGVVPPAREN